MRAARALALAIVATLAVVPACERSSSGGRNALDDGVLTVASFNFPESVLLAEIYAQSIEGAGYEVERELELGTRELVIPAMQSGLVEFVPEYSGSALEFLAGPGTSSFDPEATHRALVVQFGARGVAVLDPAEAEDQNGFAVTSETAERNGLRSLSDLAGVSGQLTFGGPPECRTRPLCLLGLGTRYGIEFEDVVALDAGGPLTVAALAEGTVDVALLFTSDGAIERNGFVLLRDDRRLQPAENVTPVIRRDALSRFGPGLAEIVNEVSSHLSTSELRTMSAELALGRKPAEVATDWLAANGLDRALE